MEIISKNGCTLQTILIYFPYRGKVWHKNELTSCGEDILRWFSGRISGTREEVVFGNEKTAQSLGTANSMRT